MAKKDVVKLLVRLFGDPKAHEQVKKNPHKALAAAGLSQAERELILSKDDAKIRAYLGSHGEKASIQTKAGLAAIKSSRTGAIKSTATSAKTAAIKSSRTAAIKSSRTAAIKSTATTAAIKSSRTAAIKSTAIAPESAPTGTPATSGTSEIKTKFKK